MGSDFYFRMGSTHAICQDYAIAGERQGLHYALLSDGCSGEPIIRDSSPRPPRQPGAPYTDFGARFLVRAAQWRLESFWNGSFPGQAIASEAAGMACKVGVPEASLDATLLTAVSDGSRAIVFQTGDGVIAWRDLERRIHYETVSFGNGAPRYLSYCLDPRRHEALIHPENAPPETLEAAGTFVVTSNTFQPGRGWGAAYRRQERFDANTPYERRLDFYHRPDASPGIEVVVLFSDGVESFQLKDGTVIPLEQVLEHLLEFKAFKGEFLVRRCTRFLQKFCVEQGWRHADDFSAVGIYLEGEEQESPSELPTLRPPAKAAEEA